MKKDTIYMDNNATTRVADEVIAEMTPFLNTFYGNPSSMHVFGGQVRHKIDEARRRISRLLNCEPEEIIFNSCGTESDNAAVKGVLEYNTDIRHIITSRVEHPAVKSTCNQLQKKGYRLTELHVDADGQLDLNELQNAIDDEPVLVTIMYANNETGVIFPIERIAQIVKAKGGVMHTDAVQGVGKIPIDLKKTPVDLLSLSGHKLHAPKGVGVLYVRKGTSIAPQMTGGHQEFGKRAGTENIAGIVALGKACELAGRYIDEENTRVRALRDKLEAGILNSCSKSVVNGSVKNRLANTANISFEYIEGEAILLMMDHLNIAASSGSACTSGSLEPSHVLRAMGIPFTLVHGSIRFSLSRYNTEEEVDYIIKEMPPLINRLRDLSPFNEQHEPSTGGAAPY